jgi:hypothetical protein
LTVRAARGSNDSRKSQAAALCNGVLPAAVAALALAPFCSIHHASVARPS